MMTWRGYVLLALCALVILLPGITAIPPIDRDEPRYAQAARQMIESGDYLNIHFQQEPRYKKPIGIYWLQSAAARLFSTPPYDDIAPYRLPSLLGAVLAILATAWGVSRIDGGRAGLLAGAILLCSGLINFEARIAKTDAVLLAAVCLTQFILARAYLRPERLPAWLALSFWLCLAAGILVKGPVLPLINGGTIMALWLADRRVGWIRQLRPLPGALLCLALTLPWLLWIGLISRGQFYGESVAHDFLGKILTGQDRGFLPPGYHLALLPVCFGAFAWLALRGVAETWRARPVPVHRFILAWIVPVWIIGELIFTKLPHYVLPCYPALAWAAARFALQDWPPLPERQRKFWQILNILCGGVMLGVTGATMLALPLLGQSAGWALPILCGIAAALIILQMRWQWRRRPRALLCGIGGAAALMLAGFGFLLPGLAPLMIAPQAAAWYRALRPCAFSRLVTSGVSEPSLVFAAGTDTIFANGAAYAATLSAHDRCAVAMIAAEQEQTFRIGLAIEGVQPVKLGAMRGYNYNGGGWQDFFFYRSTREPLHELP